MSAISLERETPSDPSERVDVEVDSRREADRVVGPPSYPARRRRPSRPDRHWARKQDETETNDDADALSHSFARSRSSFDSVAPNERKQQTSPETSIIQGSDYVLYNANRCQCSFRHFRVFDIILYPSKRE